MNRIVIFGGEGFIGSHLRELLDRDGIEYIAPTEGEIDLTDLEADLRITTLVNDGDSIVMIAAKTAEHGDAYQLTDWNIRMAANVLRGIKGKDIGHFVCLSSDSVYGPVDGIMTEEAPLRANALYGMMHMIREQMFKERFKPEDLTIIRPCAVYGVGDTHNAYGINQFIKSARSGKPIELFGEGEEFRSNIHVDDLANIIATAVKDKIAVTFNANCGVTYSFRQQAHMVQRHTNADIAFKPRTAPITHRYVDNAKLISAFPKPRAASEGIVQTIKDLYDDDELYNAAEEEEAKKLYNTINGI